MSLHITQKKKKTSKLFQYLQSFQSSKTSTGHKSKINSDLYIEIKINIM